MCYKGDLYKDLVRYANLYSVYQILKAMILYVGIFVISLILYKIFFEQNYFNNAYISPSFILIKFIKNWQS